MVHAANVRAEPDGTARPARDADIRAIELPEEAREKVRPFRNVMALVERDLGRAEDAAAARDAKEVGAAARSMRLNAIDVDAEARRAAER